MPTCGFISVLGSSCADADVAESDLNFSVSLRSPVVRLFLSGPIRTRECENAKIQKESTYM